MSNAIVSAVHQEGIRKMSFDERKSVEEQLRELKDQVKRADPDGDGTHAKPEMLQQLPQLLTRIKKLEELLNKDDDLVPKGDAKNPLTKRKKELEERIRKEMPSERDSKMTVKTSGSREFDRAVAKTVHHQKTCGKLIEEWQEIMRRLEPDNPEAADVRKLLG